MFFESRRCWATASACALPLSARASPAARPGSTLPVDGVWPWRTNTTTVGAGGVGMRSLNRSLGCVSDLHALRDEIVHCRKCPRLVAWREQVAVEKRASFANDHYWARPVPGFGDPAAAILVVGLAPAAHGGNRTGRVFTGDRSGDFLF